MKEIKKNNICGLLCLSSFLIFTFLILGNLFEGMEDLYYLIVIFIALGLVVLLIASRYFFEPNYMCPRCGQELESIYTEICPQCNLRLFTKCNQCDSYTRTYVDGNPIQYCSKCGGRFDAQPTRISEPIVQEPARREKIHYCPNCGSSLRDEKDPKFCPFCGKKI
ncbi:MAG: hypothetical protein ACOC44_12595 [Promethearchaeia archaeon]